MYSAVVTMAWIQHAFGGAPQWLLSILLVLGAIVAAGIVSLLPALLKHTLVSTMLLWASCSTTLCSASRIT